MALPPGARAATTWHVSPNSGGACTQSDPNCATIQAAVGAASFGDTIQVAAGTYKEHVVIAKDLTVSGAGAAQTIVDGTQFGRVLLINNGTVNLSGMTITNGNNGTEAMISGAGILNGGATTITNCVISNNHAFQSGGGILTGNTLTITNSTIYNNSADQGGGIYNTGSLTLNNCTVSNNSAFPGAEPPEGGGIVNDGGVVNITNSTVAGNSAGGNPNPQGGGVYNVHGGTLNSRNTIFAGNTAAAGPDLSGPFTSQGHNLVGKGDGSTGLVNGVNGDIVGTASAPVDAKLSLLGFYGGPTPTQLPLCGSPAIDAGDDAVLNPPLSLATDQRGAARKAGAHVDIGAVERQQAVQVNSNDAGAGSLRQLIADAQDGAVIDLDPCAAATVTLTSGELLINKNLTINGPGPSLLTVRRSAAQGTPNFHPFNVQAGTVNISGLTVSNGNVSGANFPANSGGAIFNAGSLILTNVAVMGSTASSGGSGGGGIYNSTAGKLILASSIVSGNTGNGGGGVSNDGTLNLANSTVSGNAAGVGFGGGGIYNSSAGKSKLANSTVSGNTAGDGGGGIFNNGGSVVLTNCTVSGNSTASGNYAGAIANAGTLALTNSTVSANVSGPTGGAVFNSGGATVNVWNTIVAKNTVNSGANPDLSGSFKSQGHNLIGAGDSNNGFTNGVNGDIVGTRTAPVDPKLLPLGDYGGPTLTQLPSPSSPAIDAGDSNVLDPRLNPPVGPTTDQRGSSRLVGSNVDIGAVEFDPAADTIDAASFFVRQHYHDFLNRAPDPPGLQFWTNGITSCGADANCTAVKRVDTSAAFFLSIEFQGTGYLVYKMYKAAFGNLAGKPVAVQRAPFLADTQAIQSTPAQVIVGQGNWQAQLEANKTAFAQSFVQRTAFQSLHGGQGASAFVDSLLSNAGVTPTAAERSAAVNAFGGGGAAGQAAALRSVAESTSVTSATSDESFVLMQYFGYLQRDPDAAPDKDFSGYNFWLAKLNQFGGNYVQAEMVKAFITSIEYRQRFGD
jgi:hypothetical protein